MSLTPTKTSFIVQPESKPCRVTLTASPIQGSDRVQLLPPTFLLTDVKLENISGECQPCLLECLLRKNWKLSFSVKIKKHSRNERSNKARSENREACLCLFSGKGEDGHVEWYKRDK